VLARELDAPTWPGRGARVAYHDEWIDDEATQSALLNRVLELDPTAQWAFDRISLQLTAGGRWDELIALYDRAIAQTDDPERKATLLEEAAHVAKDSAGKPELAVDYLTRVSTSSPDRVVRRAGARLSSTPLSRAHPFWEDA
jgi:tetratricopeptide (TPR) repeat protein